MKKHYTLILALLLMATTNLFAQQAMPFTDGFEDGSLQSYWTTGGSGTPSVSTTQAYNGTYALAFNTDTENSSYVEVELESAADPALSFWYYFDHYYDKDLTVDIYTNGSWTTDIWTDGVTYSNDDQWLRANIDLSAYDTESGSFKLRFTLTYNSSVGSDNFYMDDIMVGGPSNPDPNNTSNSALSGTLTWDHGVNVSTYDVKFGEAGNMSTVVSGATVSGTSGSYSYSGLDYVTEYEWQVIYYKDDDTQVDGPVWSFYTKIVPNGDGTESNPFEISSVSELITLSQNSVYWTAHYKQTADITFDSDETQVDWNGDSSSGPSEGFLPIGNNTTKFTGSYDGQDYTIDNIYIDRPAADYIGLFGYPSEATFENLGVTNVDITGSSNVGALIGRDDNTGGSTVSDCYSSGSVYGNGYAGGLGGLFRSGTVTGCYSSCSVNATNTNNSAFGGLAGYSDAVITDCYSTGAVSADDNSQVGGLVGRLRNGSIAQSYSTANVSGSDKVGGLVGYVFRYTKVSNSYATGTVTRSSGATEETFGAFVGSNGEETDDYFYSDTPGGDISYCYATGNVVYDGDTDPTDKGFVGLSVATDAYTPVYTANFFDSEVSNQSTATGATAKTTAEMKDVATFTDTNTEGLDSPWDFVNDSNDDSAGEDYWDMDQDENNGYPFLTWQVVSQPGLWTGEAAADNNWNTAGNWDDGQVPTSTVDVTIPETGSDPIISAAATCQNITIQANGALTINSSQTLDVTGDFTLNDGADFTNSGTLKFSGADCHLSDNRSTKSTLGNLVIEDTQ